MGVWLKAALAVFAVGVGLCVLIAAVKTRKPIRCLLSSGVQGLCALGLVDLLGAFTGVSLGFSWFSAGICFGLGMPGVIGVLLAKLVMGL